MHFVNARNWKTYVGIGGLVIFVALVIFNYNLRQIRQETEASRAAESFASSWQREALLAIAVHGGSSLTVSANDARSMLESDLQMIIDRTESMLAEIEDLSSGTSEQLKARLQEGYSFNRGLFAGLTNPLLKQSLSKPRSFLNSFRKQVLLTKVQARSLLNIYIDRAEWIAETKGVSIDELFELARQSQVNLMDYSVRGVGPVAGDAPFSLIDRGFVSSALGVDGLPPQPIINDELAQLASSENDYEFLIALMDHLGAYFNACSQCGVK